MSVESVAEAEAQEKQALQDYWCACIKYATSSEARIQTGKRWLETGKEIEHIQEAMKLIFIDFKILDEYDPNPIASGYRSVGKALQALRDDARSASECARQQNDKDWTALREAIIAFAEAHENLETKRS